MSLAITDTETRIGRRTLGVYQSRNVYRGPAEPGPRSADTLAHRLSGLLPQMTQSDMLRAYEDPNHILGFANPPIQTPALPTTNSDGTASQAATGVAVSQTAPLNTQAIATIAHPTTIPTATATIAPSGSPGYLVINTGGGTVGNAAPDYVSEIESWLTSQSLISGIPNWGVALAAALVLGFAWKEKGRR